MRNFVVHFRTSVVRSIGYLSAIPGYFPRIPGYAWPSVYNAGHIVALDWFMGQALKALLMYGDHFKRQ
jgi:hypothetical protein